MHDRLAAASSAARRHGQPNAVLMVDIDHFNKVNDTRGHDGAKIVLRAMDVLVREADAALYVAKRDGRNRVITSTGEV